MAAGSPACVPSFLEYHQWTSRAIRVAHRSVLNLAHQTLHQTCVSTNSFLAIVGTVLVLLTGMLTLQKLAECHEKGGVACCFGRLCPAQKPYSQTHP